MQLFLSLLTSYWSQKRFIHHSKLRLCTTKEFFLIESIKICDDSNNENQYLCLQLDCLVQSQKSFSLSEINTSTFRWYKFKTRANSKRSSKRELEKIRNGSKFYTFEYKQFTAENWWTKRNNKNIKPNGYWYCRNEIR